MTDRAWDYVIVGGGSAGSVLAITPFTDTVVKNPSPVAIPPKARAPVAGSCAPPSPPVPVPAPVQPPPAQPKPSQPKPSQPQPSEPQRSRHRKPSEPKPSKPKRSKQKPASPPDDPAPQPAAPLPAPVTPAAAPAVYMQPFPTVRIRGYTVAGGARITIVSVSGKSSARIRGICAGSGCPRDPSPVHPPARLRKLERFFRTGTVLQIRVTAGGAIGKYTSFRILANRPPRRVDRCLLPGRWAPVRCPAT